MNKDKKTLQVGDTVYMDSYYRGLSKAKITRVTNTRAFAGKSGFQRKYSKEGYINKYPRATGCNRTTFWIETDELKAKHEIQIRVAFLSKVKWAEHNVETMTEVMKLLGE